MTEPVPGSVSSLGELFLWRCRQQPQSLAYAFGRDNLHLAETVTYEKLASKVGRTAQGLRERAEPGSRALLAFQPGIDIASAFWACILAGLVPIPAPPPDPLRLKNSLPRLRAIVHDADAAIIVTDAANEVVKQLSDETNRRQITCAVLDELGENRPVPTEMRGSTSPIAYLQYTSGSTMSPRGVMISHRNVLEQCRSLVEIAAIGAESRSLCWLPYFHDYGLVHGIIAPLYAGIPAFVMSPLTFLRRPLRWIEAIEHWAITHSGGPNFAYDSCVQVLQKQREWTGDLTRWTVASCGAEPIHRRTIERFCEAFSPHGFRRTSFKPSYGLAESTLVVSTTWYDEEPMFVSLTTEGLEQDRVVKADGTIQQARSFVGCGRPLPGHHVKIVNPLTLLESSSEEIGEIWVTGPSVAEGYWNRPDVTRDTFRRPSEKDGEIRCLRTGDLGFLHDGQVFVTGRLKDLIIVNGRNLYPQDLEQAVEACTQGFRAGGCAAFTIDSEESERLIIVQELDRAKDFDADSAATAIRTALAEQFDVPVWAVVFVRSGAIPRTSSGKLQRHACRKAYLDQSLPVLASRLAASPTASVRTSPLEVAARTHESFESRLIELLAEYANIDPARINPATALVDFGLDSLKVSLIKNRLEEEFGVELSFARWFGGSTVHELVSAAEQSIADRRNRMGRADDVPTSVSVDRRKGDAEASSSAFPLSPNQERIWLLEQMHPGSGLNHMSLAIQIDGALDTSLLAAGLNSVAQRHEMLRASFSTREGNIHQSIQPQVSVPIRHVSLEQVPGSGMESEIRRWVREEATIPFDLANAPLLRALVLKQSAHRHTVVLTVHRLIGDGWSLRILAGELSAFYRAGGRHDGLLLRPDGNYRSYVNWQRAWNAKERDDQLTYWIERLRHLPPPIQLPIDRPRTQMRQFLGGGRSRRLSGDTVHAIEDLCRRQGTTKFMVLYAAFAAWLRRCARIDDVVIGSVIANRRLPQWESTFGYFVNPVVLRLEIPESDTAAALIMRAREVIAGAHDHQDIPFERILESAVPTESTNSGGLFNIMMVWEDDPLLDLALPHTSISHLPIEDQATEFDLTLLIVNGAEGLDLVMLYNRALFDGVTVDRMLGQLDTLLTGMVRQPTARLAHLPSLDDEERKRIVTQWNDTATDLPFTAAVPEAIEARMQRAADHVAAVCGDARLTYRDLQSESTAVAQAIRRMTNGENVRIGLCVERSVHSLAGLLGILKAGAAYVPLDPNAPEQRQRFILDDAGVTMVVTQRHLRSQLPLENDRILEVDKIENRPQEQTVPFPDLDLDRLAYIIYTSGSTGRPKGVEVTHRALRHSLAARLQYYHEPVQRCLLTFPLAFDGSITSIFWTLLHGGTLIIPSEDAYRDPQQLISLVARHRISHTVLIPSLYDLMLHHVSPTQLDALRVVVAAGEPLPVDIVHRHHERVPDAVLYNEYGPTEAAVWTTVYRTNGTEQGARIPIGKPIANAKVYILDPERQPVPVGVVGELYIGGAGLARGYHNQPDLTQGRFIENPFLPGTRLYKTGDLGLFRPDGNIEFIGREDDQVKIRGHRIELGEIEGVLRDLPGVRDAAVVMRDEPVAGPSLVAFVTSEGTTTPTGTHLQELLSRRLPSYMVPQPVVVLSALPSLPSGKIDRNALRRRKIDREAAGAMSAGPRDHIEYTLLELWGSVLGRKPTDVHQSFFDMGGHSLLATQVVARIRELFRVELPLRILFDSPSIAGVAEQIRIEQRRIQARPPLPPIVPVSRTAPLPLSYSQQRMWFIQQLAPEATAYNLLFVSRQRGSLKVPVLRQVVDLLARRHEAFRTTFAMTNNGLVQRIAPWQPPHLAEIDLRRLPREQREEEARRLAEEEGAQPFDLGRGPLARISVLRLDHEDHILVLNMHHIVGDQWSFGILGRDFAAYYNALCQNLPIPDTALPIQYADYATWQRRCLTDEVLREQERYWIGALQDLPILYLPTDFPRPSMQTFRGSYCSIDIPQSLIEQVKLFGSKRQVTSFMTMLACFQLLLSRYSGQTDVAVGSPIANRTQMAMEELIGTFVNTLVFRLDLAGNPSFLELVERVKETALGAFANQDYPFDRLVDTLQVQRDPSMAPLVQVLFNLANAPIGDIQLYGLKWEPFEVDPGSAQFDLSVTIEIEVAKKAYLTFNTDLFTRDTAERLLRHFVALLHHALANPHARISEITMLTKVERSRLLDEWNRTAFDYPHTQCFTELFETQAQRTPDAVAVSMMDRLYTYRELNAEANRLARLLSRLGNDRQLVVGLCLERSVEMVTALLGIMKSGGSYVPLDPDYPRDRVRFMVEDSGAELVVTTSALAERFSGQSCRVVCLDRIQETLRQEPDDDLPPASTVEDIVYILYTSGSTGQPKGVAIRHRSLVNFLWSMKREPGCSATDIMLSLTTLSFDIAGLELYLPLLVGARVEIVPRHVSMEGRRLAACIKMVQPTLMQATPATWRLLLESGWEGSSTLTALCGGEALPFDLASQLCARTKCLWNMYGPTETTIWSMIDRIEPHHTEIAIGRPIANTEIYLLDGHQQPVPLGVSGEIYIGGDGLAKGYHRRPDLTADRFVRHPFSNDPDARLYRTGDVARYREDGKLVHMGRMDHQVKVRGFRIELGEVESVLARHPKIAQAVVTAREDQYGLKQLAAYIVPRTQPAPAADELRAYLRAIVPEYMVPSFFVSLDKLPLTANKKIDVRALPAPAAPVHAAGAPFAFPRNAMEVQLTALWQQVLGIQEIGIHDNFFELGGHSLKAAQLFFHLETVFGKQLPLATLFQAPTIAQLADVLAQARWTPPWQSLVAIQPSGSATPLFVVPGVGGNVLVFARLAKLLGPEQPIYGLQARGLDGKETPFTSVPEMAAHYVEQIKRIQPTGPYFISGVCTGGLIAYEMVQQLSVEGQEATVFMMDTWHPDSYARYKHRLFGHLVMMWVLIGKTVGDLRTMIRQPMSQWWSTVVRKTGVLASLLTQTAAHHIEDTDFQIQRLTQATFLAVARYRVRSFGGTVVNIVASRRRVDDVIPDTRHRWPHLGGQGSFTVHIPAEDSGRLFVSPHVEELAARLQPLIHRDPGAMDSSGQESSEHRRP
ncbi:MAG TPA: amino acid adenylation domain-containing protein [Nitrospira sp.]|nr:amino acid adenylation domain-containing protein [Nitrospira sp.]